MQPSVLKALEFDRIREALAHEAATPFGRERALALEPASDAGGVQHRLDLTTAAVKHVQNGGSLAIDAPEDLPTVLQGLDVPDQPIEPMGLLGLARAIGSVARVADGLSSASPLLTAIADRAPSFAAEADAVRRAILPTGDVSDDASPVLREVREKLRRARAKLRTTLESLVKGRDSAKYLQDQIITDRNGRYVVVVRAEHRDSVPGLVHGSSASGASLYVEPMGAVEANNDVVALVGREQEEVRRILLALTDAFRRRADDLEAWLDVAADIDELHAKAGFAARMSGLAPTLVIDGRLEFRGARHPLLVLDRAMTPVASDLLLVPPARALVISGPNTGGKTVALKAVGLLALMAQAGLLIPIDPESRFTPFRTIFADIGDEQSIAASLSTFSAHIANIVSMERALDPPALVLLDEVGGGTDPVEGGALGIAVIDHFRRRGAMVVATTHDDAIKSYAATTDGVLTAAFGFNPETYAPTYRLIYGAPGRSLALEIADRLGMPAAVIEDARSRRSDRESLLSTHLARVDRELATLDAARVQLETDRALVAEERKRLLAQESRVAEREAVLKRRLDDRVNDKLREAREEVDRIVGRLRQKADVLGANAASLSTGDLGNLRVEGRAALESVASAAGVAGAPAEDSSRLDGPPAIGQVVFVTTFGTEGTVRGVSGKDVDLDVKGKRIRVKLDALRRRGAAPPERSASPASKSFARKPGVSTPLVITTRELVVIGNTVDEATDKAEKFLDQALLNDERRLRIVHGHGTGRLRDGIREYFRKHPLVQSVSAAADDEGGGAATIVELKD